MLLNEIMMLERYLNELIHQATILEQANNINIIHKNKRLYI